VRRIRTKWWIGGAVLLVIITSLGWWWLRGDDSDATAGTTTETVAATTVKQTVSASGTVAPFKTADLDFDVSGTVTAVLVEAGDTVTKGEALAEVDDAALVASQTAASASLTAAKAQLSDDYDADASAVQIASDKANIVSAQASLDSAEQAVDDATLRATIAGTVTAVDLAVGDRVGSSSGSSGAGGSAATGSTTNAADSTAASAVSIVSDGKWLVEATVASSDIDQLTKGMQAQLTVTGVTDTVFGTVSTVGLVAETNSSGAAVFPLTIAVTGTRDDLFSGTSVTASIVVKQTENVIAVNSRALKTSGDTTYVTKVVDGKAVKQDVTVGEAYGATTEITEGLSAGDVVQVPGFIRPSGTSGRTGSGQDGGEGGFGGNFTPPSGGNFAPPGGGTFGGQQ
jgi:macrolide-specific efflux system membrane fusion protein